METFFSAFPQNNSNQKMFKCELCNTSSDKKDDLNRHMLTKKHLRRVGNLPEKEKYAKQYVCHCGKKYNTNSGLWKHTKICLQNTTNTTNTIVKTDATPPPQTSTNAITALLMDNTELKNLILEVMRTNVEFQKQNQELQKQMLEAYKNSQASTTINSNTINNNKTFNLQFFLNEQCKNAMNLNEFVGSFQLVLEDLLRVGAKGYIEGISQIIIEKLKQTDIYLRPIHCSDLRRDTLYFRLDNVWNKDTPGNEKMAIAIKDIGKQNFLLLNEYRKLHPDCLDAESEFNDPYTKLIMHAAGGGIKENVDKVIKNILKQIVIEK